MLTSLKIIILVIFIISALPAHGDDGEVLLREEFNYLQNWKPLSFPKIKEHSIYSIEKDGNRSYLKAESSASASGIVMEEEFNVYEYRKVRWRWKVTNVYKMGDAETRSGDDYPLRIYIMFKYDPDKASFAERIKYGLVKSIYDEYPPHSSMNYIWANRKHKERIIANSYADESKMILLQTGSENTGKWIEQEIDIIDDYRRAFGEDPPAIASLAIMNDSDNTGESSVSYVDYIEVSK